MSYVYAWPTTGKDALSAFPAMSAIEPLLVRFNPIEPLSEPVVPVVLTVTVSAKYGEATIFLAEVKQAGLLVIRNLSEEDAKRAISTYCPGVLFPYARAAISHLVAQGGFPQFLLPPVNFDALYASSQNEGANATRN